MKKSSDPELYVALVHSPVVNKNGETITSAVTNLDLHDIARASKTYGIKQFYVVTPLKDQQALTHKILSHWISGSGSVYNRIRGDALEIVTVKNTISEVLEEIKANTRQSVKTIVTSAKKNSGAIGFAGLREKLKPGVPHVLLFGTAWGLAPEIVAEADYILEPIMAGSAYNHLSVRSAVSIILDRLIDDENISL